MQTIPQLDGAFEYLKKVGSEPVDRSAFDESSGVGVVVTPEQISAAVGEAIGGKKEQLLEERWGVRAQCYLGPLGRVWGWVAGLGANAILGRCGPGSYQVVYTLYYVSTCRIPCTDQLYMAWLDSLAVSAIRELLVLGFTKDTMRWGFGFCEATEDEPATVDAVVGPEQISAAVAEAIGGNNKQLAEGDRVSKI